MLLTRKEEQIAVAILEGRTIPYCSKYYGVAEHRCVTIVNRYCARTNRPLYDIIRKGSFEFVAPITGLRKHSDEFIRPCSDGKGPVKIKITAKSSILDLPRVQTLALNALWARDIKTVADLLKHDERKLLRLPKLGRIGLKQLKDCLGKHGFTITQKAEPEE